MKFHVASRGGVAINFDFPAGGGGIMFKLFQLNDKIFLRSFVFY